MSETDLTVGGVPKIEKVQLSDVAIGRASDFGVRRAISETVELTVKSAMRMPSADIGPRLDKNAVLADSAHNVVIRDRNAQMKDGYGSQMDAITEKFVTLYEEMTIFKVTWQIAKRTGRDVETLLKAQ